MPRGFPTPVALNTTTNDADAIKVVIFAEGYTLAQLTTFDTDAINAMNAILAYSPYIANKNKFKFYKCRSISVNSGITTENSPHNSETPVSANTVCGVINNSVDLGYIDFFEIQSSNKRNNIDDVITTAFPSETKVFCIVLCNTSYEGGGAETTHASSLSTPSQTSSLVSVVSIASKSGTDWKAKLVAEFTRSFADLDYEHVDATFKTRLGNSAVDYHNFLDTYALRDNVTDDNVNDRKWDSLVSNPQYIEGGRWEATGIWRSQTSSLMTNPELGYLLAPLHKVLIETEIDGYTSSLVPKVDIPTNFVTVGAEPTTCHMRFVIIGDGYLASDESVFDTDASATRTYFESLAPFSANIGKIKWQKLFTASAEDGPSVSPYGYPGTSFYKSHNPLNTFWGSESNYGWYHHFNYDYDLRVLLDDHMEAQFGSTSKTYCIMLCNMRKYTNVNERYGGIGEFPGTYGGGNGAVTLTSGWNSMLAVATTGGNYDGELAIHEMAHSFGALGDEYDYGYDAATEAWWAATYPINDNFSDTEFQAGPYWDGKATTTDGQGCLSFWYKSDTKCLMETLTDPNVTAFSPVNEHLLQERIDYEDTTCPPTGTSFDIATPGKTSYDLVCCYTPDLEKWHNGTLTYPTLNDYVYNDQYMATPFDGQNKWWKTDRVYHTVKIDSNGKVIDEEMCEPDACGGGGGGGA